MTLVVTAPSIDAAHHRRPGYPRRDFQHSAEVINEWEGPRIRRFLNAFAELSGESERRGEGVAWLGNDALFPLPGDGHYGLALW